MSTGITLDQYHVDPVDPVDGQSTEFQRRQVNALLKGICKENASIEFTGANGFDVGMRRAKRIIGALRRIGVVSKGGSCFMALLYNRMTSGDYPTSHYGTHENGVFVWGGFKSDVEGARFEEAVIQAGVRAGVFVNVRLHETSKDGKSASFARKKGADEFCAARPVAGAGWRVVGLSACLSVRAACRMGG